MVVEPLELENLATLIKAGNEVRIVDMILEKKELKYFIQDFKPDVVCFTGYITHIPVIIEYCQVVKMINPLIITVTGGVHIEQFPEDINHECIDYRVVRNATRTFPQLIGFLGGKPAFPPGVLRRNEVRDESQLPAYDFYSIRPDRTLTQKYRNRYFYVFHNRVALMKASFGCPYKCNFCFCRKVAGDIYFARPIQDVIEELISIQEKEVYFVDDDFLVNVERVREFIRLVKEKGIKKKYLIYGRADFIGKNPELIREFKSIGLRTIIVGLESFDDLELSDFNKQTDSNINRMAMAVLNKYGVNCYAGVIISPSWGPDEFRKAGDIMLELGIKFVNLQPLTPLKGTGVIVNEEDLVIDRHEFAKWDLAHVALRPEKMNLTEFYQQILDLYIRLIFNPGNMLSLLKYPVRMQFRMAIGIRRVMKQYKSIIMEVGSHA
jgi:radical SAM superfamily enzyme YgiQ (UPF0313 family)